MFSRWHIRLYGNVNYVESKNIIEKQTVPFLRVFPVFGLVFKQDDALDQTAKNTQTIHQMVECHIQKAEVSAEKQSVYSTVLTN